MKLSRTFIALMLFFFGVGALQAQTPTTSSQSEDCGHFVQQFYNWYVATETALMKRNGLGSALEVTLREKQSSLSPELLKALKEDLAASKKSPAEIVGLDFDPFLNAQEIAERYLVGKITPKGDHYWVEVFGVWNGQKNSNPDVVPELAFRKRPLDLHELSLRKNRHPGERKPGQHSGSTKKGSTENGEVRRPAPSFG